LERDWEKEWREKRRRERGRIRSFMGRVSTGYE